MPRDAGPEAATPTAEVALRQAQRLFKEQASRHRQEQERLFERLLQQQAKASLKAELSVAAFQSAGGAASLSVSPTLCSSEVRIPEDSVPIGKMASAAFDLRTEAALMPESVSKAASYTSDEQAFYAVAPRSSVTPRSNLMKLEDVVVSLGLQTDAHTVGGRCLRCLYLALRSLRNTEEPERAGCLANFVSSKFFRTLCMICIALNAIFLVFMTDHEMENLSDTPDDFYIALENFFVVFYAVELLLKLCVHRMYFFWCDDANWNILDLVLVCLSLLEIVFRAVNYSFMRSFRLFKLARALRVMRTIPFFSELRLVFDCVLGSMFNLIWCLVMVIFIVYIFALLIVQSLSYALSADMTWTPEQQRQVYLNFGTVGKGMVTLIQSSTGGLEWGDIYELLASIADYLGWCFLMYIFFFAIAAWNIVTSLFVEKALKLAQPDIETIATEKNMKDAIDAEELTKMFTLMDADKSGRISLKELKVIMEHPKFRSHLRARGIELTDAELFHRMLLSVAGDSEPDIDIHFIVAACLRMKGGASSMDLHALSFVSKLTSRRLQQHITDTIGRLERIEGAVAALAPAAPVSGEKLGLAWALEHKDVLLKL